MYAKDLSEPKYQFLIKKRENAGIRHWNDAKTFIECSNTMDDVYENIDDYNPIKKRKNLSVFDDMIEDIMNNKKIQAIIKDLFIRAKNLNISIVFCFFHSLIFLFQTMSDWIQCIIWFWKLTAKENCKILQLIILPILIVKILWRFAVNVQKNRILFWQLIQHYQQVIL